MPSFLIGVDEVEASGEHGAQKGLLRTHKQAAQSICDSLVAKDFDIAFSTHMTVDLGISHAVQWLLGGLNAPIVPIVVNCFAPPLPSIRRALTMGEALRGTLRDMPQVERVALIGNGGLSHSLPFPDWRKPKTGADGFLADSWRNGHGAWERYEVRRRKLIVNAPPVISESFDQEFLQTLVAGESRQFAEDLDNNHIVALAGNGGNGIRAWLMMAACLEYRGANVLNYSPMPEWLTGMTVAVINPN